MIFLINADHLALELFGHITGNIAKAAATSTMVSSSLMPIWVCKSKKASVDRGLRLSSRIAMAPSPWAAQICLLRASSSRTFPSSLCSKQLSETMASCDRGAEKCCYFVISYFPVKMRILDDFCDFSHLHNFFTGSERNQQFSANCIIIMCIGA
jgi:hypothetical protein